MASNIGLIRKLIGNGPHHFINLSWNRFGIDDPLPLSPNQKPTTYPQTRTRINNVNKGKFDDTV
jgi:hypothetical protein